LEYTILESVAARNIDRTVVSSESEQILKAASNLGAEKIERPGHLMRNDAPLSEVVLHTIDELGRSEGYAPDFVVLLQYVSPLKTSQHIDEVVDTWRMFSVDSVVSVTENKKFLWQPGEYGLEALFEERLLREKRDTVYEENGSVYGFTPKLIDSKKELIGESVGHTMMKRQSGTHIDSWLDLKLCETLLSRDNSLRPDFQSPRLKHHT
jgi:CMP-N-acetylneuraminic acid synthetase